MNDNKRSFTISDSYSILNDKLSNLAFNLKVDTLKGVFHYKFYKTLNLFYIGNQTPDLISYYNCLTF